jgi:hypothetical protein
MTPQTPPPTHSNNGFFAIAKKPLFEARGGLSPEGQAP